MDISTLTTRIALLCCLALYLGLAGVGCDDKEAGRAVEQARSVVSEAPAPPGAHVIVIIDSSGSQVRARTTAASIFMEGLAPGSRVLVMECDQRCRPVGPTTFLPPNRWRSLAAEQLQSIDAKDASYPFEWIRVASHVTKVAEPPMDTLPAVAVVFTDGVATAGESRPDRFATDALPLLEAAGLGLVVADGDDELDDVFAMLDDHERVTRISTEQTAGAKTLLAAVEGVGAVVAGDRPRPVALADLKPKDAGRTNGGARPDAGAAADVDEDAGSSAQGEADAGSEDGGDSRAKEDAGESGSTSGVKPSSHSGRGIGLMQLRERATKEVEIFEASSPEGPFAAREDAFDPYADREEGDEEALAPVDRARELAVHGRLEEALSTVRSRTEEHPEDVDAWMYLARLTAYSENVRAGLDVLEQMVETLPSRPETSIALAVAYRDEQQWPLRCAHLLRYNIAENRSCRPGSSADCPLASHLTIWELETPDAGLSSGFDPTGAPASLGDYPEREDASRDFRARLTSEAASRALPIIMDDRGVIHLWRSPRQFGVDVQPDSVELRAIHLREGAYRIRVVPFDTSRSSSPEKATLELELPGADREFSFELGGSPVDVAEFTFEMPDFDDLGGAQTSDPLDQWRVDTCVPDER